MTQKKRAAPASPRTKLRGALTKHLVTDFDAHGAEVIARMRADKPVDYLKMITAMLQQEDPNDPASGPTYHVIERQIVTAPHQDG
ncbi:hypothetical protein [Sphingomonas crusticola]|uniref:hypothetical protein n=1 Tax=Sphingomonas crusticola TaxID=1697973 RepID=UPI000E248E7B|nr:hypothetical protein [Sphingomonas crusticola]